MDRLIETTPDIISEAGKTPIALAALVVLVGSILCYYLFREATNNIKIVIFIPMLIGFIALVLVLADVGTNSSPIGKADSQPPDRMSPKTALASSDAAEAAEAVITRMLGGSADGIGLPFCNSESVYNTKDNLSAAVARIVSHASHPGPIDVSTAGTGRMMDLADYNEFAATLPCGLSPQDYAVKVNARFHNSNQETTYLVIIDSQTGLAKGVFN